MNLKPLPRAFYDRDPVQVARNLLGKQLIRRTSAGVASGIVVEVEAYLAETDPACHSYRGVTRRNRVMFGSPGHLYVYSIHARYCLNAVTQGRGIGSAVLIRAIEPIVGVDLMRDRRGREQLIDLARGPARLCQALDVDAALNGWDLTRGSRVWIASAALDRSTMAIATSPRIGVTSAKAMALRYFVRGNRFVSGPWKYHSKGMDDAPDGHTISNGTGRTIVSD